MSDVVLCSICNKDLAVDYGYDFAKNYPGLVCYECDSKAFNNYYENTFYHPETGEFINHTDCPTTVYINGIKCQRRYKFGGYVTMEYEKNKEYEDILIAQWKAERMK